MTNAERAKDAMPLHCDCGQGFTAAGPVVCSVHERIAAAFAAAERRGMERAAEFVERDFDHGKHEATCPHPEEPCTCLLSEVAAAIRAAAKEGA